MKSGKKALLLALCAVLLVAATVMGTMAYLTATDKVENTFTIGKVAIKLDEAKANADGTLVEGADRVKANEYKLVPNHVYAKDPTVTVLKGSEPSYVKMTVTFTKAKELDAIFAPNGADLITIFMGYDETAWLAKGSTKNETENTRTYEFWYKDAVDAPTDDVALKPLFSDIAVPGEITNTQLASIDGMKITVNAYAIQADGFSDSQDLAWAAYDTIG